MTPVCISGDPKWAPSPRLKETDRTQWRFGRKTWKKNGKNYVDHFFVFEWRDNVEWCVSSWYELVFTGTIQYNTCKRTQIVKALRCSPCLWRCGLKRKERYPRNEGLMFVRNMLCLPILAIVSPLSEEICLSLRDISHWKCSALMWWTDGQLYIIRIIPQSLY